MIKIKIEDKDIEEANVYAKKIGLLRNSIRGGKGNLIGCLGEVIASNTLALDRDSTYDYDLSCSVDNVKITFDVKTKQRNVPPRNNYWATVSDYNPNQNCDFYLFASSVKELEMCLVGYISKVEFYDKATFYNKGDLDPLGPKGQNWTFRAPCYNLQYKDLIPINNENIMEFKEKSKKLLVKSQQT